MAIQTKIDFISLGEKEVSKAVIEGTETGMLDVIDAMSNAAMKMAPKKDGHLRDSMASKVEIDGDSVKSWIRFDIIYAAYQHEGIYYRNGNYGNPLNYTHPDARPKFLQQVLDANENVIGKVIAGHIKKSVKGDLAKRVPRR